MLGELKWVKFPTRLHKQYPPREAFQQGTASRCWSKATLQACEKQPAHQGGSFIYHVLKSRIFEHDERIM